MVWAHSGVTNPAVMARMDSMKSIGDDMETLGNMMKGVTAFDAAVARAAAASLAVHAAETPALFEAEEDDPQSEAKAAIWQDYADFTEKSDALVELATGLSTSIDSVDDLPAAVRALGQACQTCHKLYRE